MEKKTKEAKNAASQVKKEWSPLTDQERKDLGREKYEREYKCKLIKWADLMDNPRNSDFGIRLKKLARYGNVDSVMLISQTENHDNNWVRVHFYTNDHIYSIGVHWEDKMEDSYLGCTASTRKNRPGEVWNRGSDLPDGKYNDETWNKILMGIIQFEMKTLQI
jgi:hypothetical protein